MTPAPQAPPAPAVGDRAEPKTYGPLTRTDIVRYAGASGDFNPLHHDDELARTAGFPSVFSIGMLQAGILAGYATDWLGADGIRRYRARFEEQVWPGDELTCTGVVTSVRPNGDAATLVDVELRCTRQTGGSAVSSTATFLVAGAPGEPSRA